MDTVQKIREGIKLAICSAGGGHAGGSLSIADILGSLYGTVMNYDSKHPNWKERDRLILSKGHAGIGLYAALAAVGFIEWQELELFGKKASRLMNHPDAHSIPGVEMSTGSLGHGLSLAVGIALAGALQKQTYFTYCILGDGECCEGSIWEAAMYAAQQKLQNLVVIVDRNKLGCDGALDTMTQLEPLSEKWKRFGFKLSEVDGHDIDQLNTLFLKLKEERNGPYAVIAYTEKGHGLTDKIAGTSLSHYISGTCEELDARFKY